MFELLLLKDTALLYKVVETAEDGGLHLQTLTNENGAFISEKESEILYAPEHVLHNYKKVKLGPCVHKGGPISVSPV